MSKGPTGPSRPGATNEVTLNALRAINQTGDSGGPIATDPIKDDQTQCPLLLAGRPYYRLQLPTWSVALLQTWMSRWRLTPSAPSQCQCSLLKLPALTAPALNATPRPSPGPLVPGSVPVPGLNTRLALSTCTHTILTPPPTCFTLEACQQSPELTGLVPSTPSRRACDRLQLSLTHKLPGFLGRSREGLYEPVLADSEREAVADLLQYLENRGETNFFSGEPLRALSTLVFSENIDLQRSASLTFAEITERDVREVDRDTLEPILFLLQSPDIEVQRAASAALGNLAVNTENKVIIVQLGGLTPLIRQMLSPNVEVQCNAVGCITNLATHEENKAKIARSGALGPLTRLAKSRDMRVQRNATGALLNMTHSDENRQQLVNAGAIPVLVQLLSSPDVDVQYYCTTALSNIAVDANNRRKLSSTEPKLVQSLVHLMDSSSPKVQCQAALALRNLASDEKYQIEIVRVQGLPPLLRLLQSSYLPLILSAVACIRNISIHPMNESPIIDANFLKPLVDLLGSTDNEEIQCHAISTLRNLAASSDRNKALVLDAGAVQKCKQLVLDVPVTVQSEMTAAIAVLALSDDLKSHLLNLGVCDVLIPLTHSPSIEVQGNSAAALGNLSSKVGDYSIFVQNWNDPNGGIHGYLSRFLQSGDATFQHIAVWTLLQLFESEDKTLIGHIGKADDIIENIRAIANRQVEAEPEFEDEDEGEVVNLAQRCLELLGQSMSKAHIEG
ncbi:vacuolar protein 8 [Metarhizium robertsii ARSEF 23]|uniref:Vacuolar protein 8 n=3 Tax=Opisthokonta TaxID=33154 RepID=E9EJE3_METRA|nr:vacuolar protein 8 [Metarhizium robertsii ARSEF 23]EFZ04263.2 vacuolar protein 8 [Metarhizium robertsii ARSEF 23]